MQKGTPSVLDRIAQTGLTPEQASKVRTDYEAGRFGEVFPAGSSGVPTLMVGREAQIRQLSNLADEFLGSGRRSLIGITVYGPRGTGKTALLNAFAESMEGPGRRLPKTNIMKMTGTVLESDAALVSRLAQFGRPGQRTTTGFEAELNIGVLKGKGARTSEDLTAQIAGAGSVEGALAAYLSRIDGPTVMLIDECHTAAPNTLSRLLNAMQQLGGEESKRVGFVLAGTPDLIDALEASSGSTWYLERAGVGERLAPMPNDLFANACVEAMACIFDAAGVSIADQDALSSAAAACKGSPYFLQLLGKASLESASKSGDVADFRADGPLMRTFGEGVQARYLRVWRDVQAKGLGPCARQLGALWRRFESSRELMDAEWIDRAISSGLSHSSHPGAEMSLGGAARHFRHLGLLWSPSGDSLGPWDLGLPSFFDYVESLYRNPARIALRASLPALEADMESLIEGSFSDSEP